MTMLRTVRQLCFCAFVALSPSAARAQAPGAPIVKPVSVTPLADGIRVPVGNGFLRLQIKSPSIVRVLFSKVASPRVDDLVVLGSGTAAMNPFATTAASTPQPARARFTVVTTATTTAVKTSVLTATVQLTDGSVTFADAAGKAILAEVPGGHVMTPATIQGEQTFNVQQRWKANDGESLYGLGQRQEGKLDLKGYDLDLWQRNMVVDIPFLVSSRGYGVLWDNTSPGKFGDTRPFEPIPGLTGDNLAAAPAGQSGATSARTSVGAVVAATTGDNCADAGAR